MENQKEIERLEFVLKDLKTNGLKSYEKHKELVLEMAIKKIKEDIEFFKRKNKFKAGQDEKEDGE